MLKSYFENLLFITSFQYTKANNKTILNKEQTILLLQRKNDLSEGKEVHNRSFFEKKNIFQRIYSKQDIINKSCYRSLPAACLFAVNWMASQSQF